MPVKISRILHAGYHLECDGIQIVFDPVFENPFSTNCYAFPPVKFDLDQIQRLKIDVVFISHYHDDHCSLESLNLIHRETPIFMFCLHDEMFALIRQLGFKNVHPLDLDQSVKVGPFEILPRRALDEDVDSIFHIKAEGLNLLNVVDSWIGPDTFEKLRETDWDLVMWPFQTMREIEVLSPSREAKTEPEIPPEWMEQLRSLKPKFLIPSSCQFRMEEWSWLNRAFFPISYKKFEREINALLPNTRVVRLDPGASIMFAKKSLQKSPQLAWITPIGEQNVDYEFDSQVTPPTTAEIAIHFPPLTERQTRDALHFCEVGLLEKFRSLDELEGYFFRKPRLWQLSLYDSQGLKKVLRYAISGTNIERTDETEPLAWTTEIPIQKLFNALFEGEALTSLYLRVNDQAFSNEIELELDSADLMEDPLVRCLYTGRFASYQLAQLRRLLETSARNPEP